MPEYEIMLVIETSVTYTVKAEAHLLFSPSDLDVHEDDIRAEPGSAHALVDGARVIRRGSR